MGSIPLLDESFQPAAFWSAAGPSSHVVLSSRARLARNMPALPFPGRMIEDDAPPLMEAVGAFAAQSHYRGVVRMLSLSGLSQSEKRYLRERNLITHELEHSRHGAVMIESGGGFIILINEEDHIRIQVIKPGLQLLETYRVADAVDTELNRFVPYAFSEELGYLTACASNLGTALRMSTMMHLPALTVRGKMASLIADARNHGVDIRGTIGNSKKTAGALYQISSRQSLGVSEIDIIEALDEAVTNIMEQEDRERDDLYADTRLDLENRIWRSYGLLAYARTMSYVEAMEHLSMIRLGIILAVIRTIDLSPVNDLMVNIQWEHLQRFFGRTFRDTAEGDEFRAEYLRSVLHFSEER